MFIEHFRILHTFDVLLYQLSLIPGWFWVLLLTNILRNLSSTKRTVTLTRCLALPGTRSSGLSFSFLSIVSSQPCLVECLTTNLSWYYILYSPGIYLLVPVQTNKLRYGMWLLGSVVSPWITTQTRQELNLINYVVLACRYRNCFNLSKNDCPDWQ